MNAPQPRAHAGDVLERSAVRWYLRRAHPNNLELGGRLYARRSSTITQAVTATHGRESGGGNGESAPNKKTKTTPSWGPEKGA